MKNLCNLVIDPRIVSLAKKYIVVKRTRGTTPHQLTCCIPFNENLLYFILTKNFDLYVGSCAMFDSFEQVQKNNYIAWEDVACTGFLNSSKQGMQVLFVDDFTMTDPQLALFKAVIPRCIAQLS